MGTVAAGVHVTHDTRPERRHVDEEHRQAMAWPGIVVWFSALWFRAQGFEARIV